MKNFYFTFGSWEGFPYQHGYLIAKANNLSSAIAKFREKYPDKHKNTVNCAFYYTEEEWQTVKEKGVCHEIID